jgi:hypothetical protein
MWLAEFVRLTKFSSSEELEALLNLKEQATSPDANPPSSSAPSSIQNSPASIQSLPSHSRPGSASTMSFPSDLESLLSPSNLDVNAQTVNQYFWNGNSHLIEGASVRIDPPLVSSNMGMCSDLFILLVILTRFFCQTSSGHIGLSTSLTQSSFVICKSFSQSISSAYCLYQGRYVLFVSPACIPPFPQGYLHSFTIIPTRPS